MNERAACGYQMGPARTSPPALAVPCLCGGRDAAAAAAPLLLVAGRRGKLRDATEGKGWDWWTGRGRDIVVKALDLEIQ